MSGVEEPSDAQNTNVDEVEVVTVATSNISLSRHASHEHVSSLAILPHTPKPLHVQYPDYRDVPVRDIMETRLVITVDAKAPIELAFELLITNHITSIPILEDGQMLGVVDFADVLNFMLSEIDNLATKPDRHATAKDLLRKSRQGTMSQSPSTSSTSSSSMASSPQDARDKPLYTLSPDAPLRDVLDLFAKGVHRAIVILDASSPHFPPPSSPGGTDMSSTSSAAGKYGIISQSTVIRYIFNNSKYYPELTRQITSSVKELGIGTQNVVTVNSETAVIDALRMMATQQVSSLGIVDKHNGSLLSNISLGDMKWAIQSQSSQFLHDSVMHFRTQVDRLSGIDDGREVFPVFDITEYSTLGYAMSKVMATKTHRIWVVDHTRKPKIVVSLTDMIRHFAYQDKPHSSPTTPSEKGFTTQKSDHQ